ncbi:hypothetical protein PHYNN_83 [Pantoea phage Phynn]|nr:hypothetical protein PHYNN_83 [Pantoea phage Phynn]
MSKIILDASDAIKLAKKLHQFDISTIGFTAAEEMVNDFLNTVETIDRFNRIAAGTQFGMNIGMSAKSVEVEEETMTWICVILERI